jgi:hypothetical protein
MAVLKTTSPLVDPAAPIATPENTLPSSSANIAGLPKETSTPDCRLHQYGARRLSAQYHRRSPAWPLKKSEMEPRFSSRFFKSCKPSQTSAQGNAKSTELQAN